MSENGLKTTESNFAVLVNDIMNGVKSLSYSALSQFLKSPRHFKRYKEDKEVTKAMEDGKMFHMACLEPKRFEEKYWVLDDSEKCKEIGGAKPRSTKVYKEWLSLEIEKNSGRTMIPQDDYDKFMNMSNAVRSNSASGKFMNNLKSTEEYFEFEHDGFKICGYKDGKGENEDGRFIIDLKKVADASYKKIRWNIEDMNLDLQGGVYSHHEDCSNYYLIFIDSSCNITVVRLTPDTLQKGFEKFEFALSEFERCAQEDLWNSSYEFYNGGLINY